MVVSQIISHHPSIYPASFDSYETAVSSYDVIYGALNLTGLSSTQMPPYISQLVRESQTCPGDIAGMKKRYLAKERKKEKKDS